MSDVFLIAHLSSKLISSAFHVAIGPSHIDMFTKMPFSVEKKVTFFIKCCRTLEESIDEVIGGILSNVFKPFLFLK